MRLLFVSNFEKILCTLSFPVQVWYAWKIATVTQTVTVKKFVSMGNASQDATQTVNVQKIRNAFKIHVMTPISFVNMITIVIEARNVKMEFVKINAHGMILVLYQNKNVSLEHVRNHVMISFVQMDQSVSKVHVTLHVMKIAINVNGHHHQLIAMMITKPVFHIV